MDDSKGFYEYFTKFPADAPDAQQLREIRVLRKWVVRQTRRLRVELLFGQYPEQAYVDALSARIREAYALDDVQIRPCCHAAEPAEHMGDFFDDCRQELPSLSGFFSGDYALEGDLLRLIISFAGSGVLHNMDAEKRIAELFAAKFGRRVTVELSDKNEPTVSLEDFERRMNEGVEHTPVLTAADYSAAPTVLFGRPIKGEPGDISALDAMGARATVSGRADEPVMREMKDGKGTLVSFNIEDSTGVVRVTVFPGDQAARLCNSIKPGDTLLVRGKPMDDSYAGNVALRASSVSRIYVPARTDSAAERRVELHTHTVCSYMDATAAPGALVARAADFGHTAVALTDHASLAGLAEAVAVGRERGVRVIAGMEAYFVSDSEPAVYGGDGRAFTDSFTVFDIETTGLSVWADRITEIGAVRVENGRVTEEYSQLVDPQIPISARITEITGISNAMVAGCPTIEQILPAFLEFAAGSVLVAHNANFDCGFISAAAKRMKTPFEFTYIDTVPLCRTVFPSLQSVKLDTVATHLGLGDFNHHRACDDARVLARIFIRVLEELKTQKSIDSIASINDNLSVSLSALRRHHITLLAKNQKGLEALYMLSSRAMRDYNFRRPVLPKSLLALNRENLLVGSACSEGELFELISEGRSPSEIYRAAAFYDFFELQPMSCDMWLVDDGRLPDTRALRGVYEEILRLGRKQDKPVVATGDVHFLDEEDMMSRTVLVSAKNVRDERTQGPLYFRTTDEMLSEFGWLGEEGAKSVVIDAPAALAAKCHRIKPLPDPQQLPASDFGALCAAVKRAAAEKGVDAASLECELEYIERNGITCLFDIAAQLLGALDCPCAVAGFIGSFRCAYLLGLVETEPEALFDGSAPVSLEVEISLPDRFADSLPAVLAGLYGADRCVFSGRPAELSEGAAKAVVRAYEENASVVLREAQELRTAQRITGARRNVTARTDEIFLLPETCAPLPLQYVTQDAKKYAVTQIDGTFYDPVFPKVRISRDENLNLLRILEYQTSLPSVERADAAAAAALEGGTQLLEFEDPLIPDGMRGIIPGGADLSARLLWFKLNRPRDFYCACLSALKAYDEVREAVGVNVHALSRTLSARSEPTDAALLVYEAVRRGFTLLPPDLLKSDCVYFTCDGDKGILSPLSAVEGLPAADAAALALARGNMSFITSAGLTSSSGISRAGAAALKESGLLDALDEAAQPRLF